MGISTIHRTVRNVVISPQDHQTKKIDLRTFSAIRKLFLEGGDTKETINKLIADKKLDERLATQLKKTLLNDPAMLGEFQKLLSTHQKNLNYIDQGTRKLRPVLRIDRQIAQYQDEIKAIKMSYLIKGQNRENNLHRMDKDEIDDLEDQITSLQQQKDNFLQTKEIVGGYELRKLHRYNQQLLGNKGLVMTPSVVAQQRQLTDWIANGQLVLLSGPVGTGKTQGAKQLYSEILEGKIKQGLITPEEANNLRAHRMINGNEETSVRDLQTKPTQMSNKSDTDKAFTYDEGDITVCLRYGLPLIIDEANRTPPNFLSALKKYMALKVDDRHRDNVTGESFQIKTPFSCIMTANEGGRYSKHTNKFQDQITREILREYIDYLPDHEIYDIFKAKLYIYPGIAHVAERDLTVLLPKLIKTAKQINDLYKQSKDYDIGTTPKLKLSSAVLDTKRLFELVTRSALGTKETFWQEINTNIVDFISRLSEDDDRKILCHLFHAQGLICAENIPVLCKGSGLQPSDLTAIVKNSESDCDTIRDERMVDPRQLATAYPGNHETTPEARQVARDTLGRKEHPLHRFDTYGRDNKETVVKGIISKITKAEIFHPLHDGKITILMTKLRDDFSSMGEDDLNPALQKLATALVDADFSQLGGEALVQRSTQVTAILGDMIAIDPNLGSLQETFSTKVTSAFDILSEEEKRKAAAEKRKHLGGSPDTFSLSPEQQGIYDRITTGLQGKGYDMAKISTINGRVAVDGSRFVTKKGKDRVQTYDAMKADPDGLTYPVYARSLFDMVGTMIGKTFDYGPDRDQLQAGSIDGEAMINYLNSKQDNLDILKKLNKLIGFDGYIPLGLDNQGKVIYALVRSVSVGFFRDYNGSSFCLVPSIEGDLLQGPARIAEFLKRPGLDPKAKAQLTNIQQNTAEMLKNGYDFPRIDVDGSVVTVDGLGIPLTTTPQTYNAMKADPKKLTHPQYAKSLFDMVGTMIGKTFDYGPDRDQLQAGSIDGEAMIDYLNSKQDNLDILKKLNKLIGFDGYIPLGLDNEGKVIYASVRSDYVRFVRDDYDNNYCLVPSIEGDPHRGLEHIDQLLTLPGLQPKAQAQLRQIKNTSVILANNGYDFARIGVENGLVTIDGLGLPIKTKGQTYNAMKADPKKLTHPQYAKSLFDMVGTMIGKTFDYGPDRDQLQAGSIDGAEMIKYLNSKQDNLDILKKLYELIGFNGYIPLGIDNQHKVIYAGVRSGSIRFFRDVLDTYDCLVPSNG